MADARYGLDVGNAAASAIGLADLSDQSRKTGTCSHPGALRMGRQEGWLPPERLRRAHSLPPEARAAGASPAAAPPAPDPSAPLPSSLRTAVPALLYLPLFVPCTFAFSILLNARRNQLPAMVGMGCLAYSASFVLGLMPSLNSINSFLSAMTVGCAGNAYANLSGRPGMPATASGVFILVPGAMALRSLSSMFENAFLGMQLTGGWLAVTVQIGARARAASSISPAVCDGAFKARCRVCVSVSEERCLRVSLLPCACHAAQQCRGRRVPELAHHQPAGGVVRAAVVRAGREGVQKAQETAEKARTSPQEEQATLVFFAGPGANESPRGARTKAQAAGRDRSRSARTWMTTIRRVSPSLRRSYRRTATLLPINF